MIRIIGLGSPFGDDRVGWLVVEQLRGRLPPDIDLVSLDRPGAALVSWMSGVAHLILIDAVTGGGPPGSLHEVDPVTLGRSAGAFSSHALDLPSTLALAERLGQAPAQIDIHGIAIAQLDGRSVSPAVRHAADTLAIRLERAFRLPEPD